MIKKILKIIAYCILGFIVIVLIPDVIKKSIEQPLRSLIFLILSIVVVYGLSK